MAPERDDIYDRIARLSELIAVASERERQLAQEVIDLRKQVDELNGVLAKGRGMVLVLVTLGSLIGLVLGTWDKLTKLVVPH